MYVMPQVPLKGLRKELAHELCCVVQICYATCKYVRQLCMGMQHQGHTAEGH